MIKVLVVEDNPTAVAVHRGYIEHIVGFSLCGVATNGAEALQIIKTQPIDLVLLDIFMPDMNGLEVLAKIREQNYSVDVILVSAAQDNVFIQTGLRNGAVDYLIKPFEFERLQAALINFEKRLNVINNNSKLVQHELDQQIFSGIPCLESELPKGLDCNTSKRVWAKIAEVNNEFSVDEMASYAGLSPVSTRKYLKYFESIKLLSTKVSYGAIGRPVYKYCCISPASAYIGEATPFK